MKLNLGEGKHPIDGYVGLDIKTGTEVSQLPYPDESVDEIRCSHLLEHFPHSQVEPILRNWFGVLKPGGVLKIAVPDFKVIAEQYLAGAQLPFQGYVMGGQTDQHDFHKAMFDREALSDIMRHVGLVGIRSWKSEVQDCASLPISLNLMGTKPPQKWPKVAAVLSVPRLGFNDFWACAYKELSPIMPIRKVTGAYWERDLTIAMEEAIADHEPEWLLTCDYDTIFTREQVYSLLDLAMRYPHADAIAPLQVARHHQQPMFTAETADGQQIQGMTREDLSRGEMLKAKTGHFGMTLIRVSKLKEIPKPWFYRTFPMSQKSMDQLLWLSTRDVSDEVRVALEKLAIGGIDGRDPDVQFWHQWKAMGNSLYIALRVPVGHSDLMIRWPDLNFNAVYQTASEFHKEGAPENVWR